jgi:putative transcriptional regulator
VQPCLLIASPQLRDPFFEKTVVLLWHHDPEGALGVVINRLLPHTVPEALDLGETSLDLSAYERSQVGWGGPVEGRYGTVVTPAPLAEGEGVALPNGLSVVRSQEGLLHLLAHNHPLRLFLGYAGWGPEQLDQEIAEGSWLWTDLDPALVLGEGGEATWEAALATLGLSAQSVWMKPVDE